MNTRPAGFLGNLDVRLLADDAAGLWRHLSRFGYRDTEGNEYWCEIGDTTDFCTVPRVWGIYDKLGNRARRSGAIHDKLYSGLVSREKADELLREMLVLDGMTQCEAEAFYLAVREFGESHYTPAAGAQPVLLAETNPA